MKQRHRILVLLGLLSALTFLDRLAIAVAGPAIQADLHIPPQYWGWILSAYVLANGIFEVPSGAMGDRRGQRGEMTRIVCWWSSFNAFTGWCRGFWQLCAARFFFGLGAAGAYPNIAGVIARWFPSRERARCQGVVWAASRLGGALAPVLIVPLIDVFGWRAGFRILALAGFSWAGCLVVPLPQPPPGRSFRDRLRACRDRRKPPRLQRNRDTLAAALPLARSLADRSCLRLLRVRKLVLFFLVSHLDGTLGRLLAQWRAVCFAAVSGRPGSQPCGRPTGRPPHAALGARKALRWIPAVCLTLTALLLAAMALFHGKITVVVLSTLGFGVMDLMLPSAWALCLAIGGRLSGTATGMMNTAGQAGGFFCTVLFGYIVHETGSYNLPLWFIAAMVLVSAAVFTRIDCTQCVDEDVAALATD